LRPVCLGDLYKKQNPVFEVRRGLDSTFIVSAARMARTYLPDNKQEREVFIKEQQLDSMPLSKRDLWDLLKGIATGKLQMPDEVVNERGDDERLGVVEAALSTDISSGDSLRESITKALTSPSEKEAERPKAKQGGFCSQALVRDTGATRGC
jgi:hypothetical protein